MLDFCFFCITYEKDFNHLKTMVASFKIHNIENIPLIIALQDNTKSKNSVTGGGRIKKLEDKNIKVILDSDFAYSYLLDKKPKEIGFSLGYINQEIAKLAFFESKYAKHYLCIDSDTIFIRDFRKSDFFYDNKTPYIVLAEDKDLHIAPYYKDFGTIRRKQIERIFTYIGLDTSKIRTCHGMQILSSEVLKDFKEHFMIPNQLSYADLILYSPFEFSWYNAWFIKSKLINEAISEPLFKIYHTKEQFVLDKLAGQTIDAIKSQYIGVIFNSNWASGKEFERLKKQHFFDKILFKIIKIIIPYC